MGISRLYITGIIKPSRRSARDKCLLRICALLNNFFIHDIWVPALEVQWLILHLYLQIAPIKGYKLDLSILVGFAFVNLYPCCEIANQICVIMLEAFASAVSQR